MTDAKDNAPSTPPVGRRARRARRLPGWKKVLLAGSVALMAAGLGLQGYSYARGPESRVSAPSGAERKGLVQPKGFLPGTSPAAADGPGQGDAESPDDGARDWYPAMFRWGFSFFVGFCIAYALRTFLKLTVVVIGLLLAVLFGLQHAGIIQVDWSAMNSYYGTIGNWLAEQTSSFHRFVTGHLPSSGTATLGLVVGFKKR